MCIIVCLQCGYVFVALYIDVILSDIVALAVVMMLLNVIFSVILAFGHSAFGWWLLFFQCQRSKSSSNRMLQKMLSTSFTRIPFVPVALLLLH
jgi:hypothetical protein